MWIVQWCETKRSKEEKALRVPTRSAATEHPCRTPKASMASRSAAKVRIISGLSPHPAYGSCRLGRKRTRCGNRCRRLRRPRTCPVLLGEALDHRGSTLDEQGFQLAVRKLLFRYRPEYGQAALRIFAFGGLRVERYPAPAAGHGAPGRPATDPTCTLSSSEVICEA